MPQSVLLGTCGAGAADGASVYKYDIENRLVERRAQGTGNTNCSALSYAGTLQAELRYDPLGRLYYLRDYVGPNGITRFAYDGNAMIAEYNNATTLLRRYVHGSNAEADDPLVWYEGTSVASSNARHLHADPRGSIVLVAGASGQTLAINTYDEYGIPDSASGNDIATKGRFRYTGQAWLPELDMYYYKARVYSPTLGRFLQTDPIGYEDQFNLYAYVGNDPVNGVDPSGLELRFFRSDTLSDEQNALNEKQFNDAVQKIKDGPDTEMAARFVELENSENVHYVADVSALTSDEARREFESDTPNGFNTPLGNQGDASNRKGTGSLTVIDFIKEPSITSEGKPTQFFSRDSQVVQKVGVHAYEVDKGIQNVNPRRTEHGAVKRTNTYRSLNGQRRRH